MARLVSLRDLLGVVGVGLLVVGMIVPKPSQASPTSDLAASGSNKQTPSLCPEPALSRLLRHRVAAGETLESIAQRYDLIPATLMGLNPALRTGSAPVGTEILIPPYNGVRVEVPAGSSWRDIAKAYNVRADTLFEINGCQDAPSVVFVPGVNWSPGAASRPAASAANRAPLGQYPLPAIASILRAYGWQLDPDSNQVVFYSGVDLAAEAGTSVLAAGEGTVAFAGEQTGYGNLVVINHTQGLQTRYAQLGRIAVRVGQRVQAGTRVGVVGVNGAASASPAYLHFEVRSNSNLGWVAQDPSTYLPALRTADQVRNRGLGGREVEQGEASQP